MSRLFSRMFFGNLLSLLVALTVSAASSLPLYESFPLTYANNARLRDLASFDAGNSAGSGSNLTNFWAAGLSYPGLLTDTNSGGCLANGTPSSGRDAGIQIVPNLTLAATNPTLYASFLLNVTTLPTSTNLLLMFASNTGGGSTPVAGVCVDNSGKLWLMKNSATPTTNTTTAITANATNLIVLRYQFNATDNDEVALWLNPATHGNDSAIPNPTLTTTNGTDATTIAAIDLCHRTTSGTAVGATGTKLMDEIRVATNWAGVTPTGTTASGPTGTPVITNTFTTASGLAFRGTNGTVNGAFLVLYSATIGASLTNWAIVGTNNFDAAGNFSFTNSASANAAGFYRVRVGTNGAVSPPVAPGISAQPQALALAVGQVAQFSVTATGTAPLAYQWFFNTNTALANATNFTFTLASAQLSNGGKYSVTITNAAGSTNSAFATLTVTNIPGLPAITTQPTNQVVAQNSNATFTVVATGTAPLAYQWFFNTNTPLLNATNPSLVLTNVQATNAGAYSVRVTNSVGAVTSAIVTLTLNSTLLPGAFYVATNGSDSNPGTLASPYKTLSKGFTAIGTGGIMYLRGGTFAQASKISLSKTSTTNRIRIWAYPGERPVINFTGDTSDGFSISGKGYHFKGIEVKLAGHNGFAISGNSNILENCVAHDNANTGIHITGSTDGVTYPAYNIITNCDSYLNFDSPVGGNADGFSAKWQVGPGNIFTGCRGWNNSDDGWDFWMATSPIIIENSWAFRNGSNFWASATFNGNGNGFKLGGNYVATPHTTRNCVSFENQGGAGRGYDENNNLAGQTIFNCIAYNNSGNGFHLQNTVTNGAHLIRNCVVYLDAANVTSGVRDHNSWNGFAVTAADFQSLDTSTATNARAADGSLPTLTLLRLAHDSSLINAGVDVGLPFYGAAPDLGAFETP